MRYSVILPKGFGGGVLRQPGRRKAANRGTSAQAVHTGTQVCGLSAYSSLPPSAGTVSAQASTAARVASSSKPLMSMYSLVMVTVKVSSPREQENLALQVSSLSSREELPPTPAAVSVASFPLRKDAIPVSNMKGMRNLLMHQYLRVDLRLVWQSCLQDISSISRSLLSPKR